MTFPNASYPKLISSKGKIGIYLKICIGLLPGLRATNVVQSCYMQNVQWSLSQLVVEVVIHKSYYMYHIILLYDAYNMYLLFFIQQWEHAYHRLSSKFQIFFGVINKINFWNIWSKVMVSIGSNTILIRSLLKNLYVCSFPEKLYSCYVDLK